MTRTEEKSILNFASRAAMFLVSLSSSSFLLARNINTCNLSKSYLLARLNTRSLHSENCLLQRFIQNRFVHGMPYKQHLVVRM